MSTLFLKYRPQTFEELVGQSSVRRTLQNALRAQRPSHAYLFAGVRGTGKTSTARIFAKGLNCGSLVEGNPCGKCNLCQATADGSLVDMIEIDAASNRGIDEIRDLREKINFAPSIARRKIYIIDEVHMLTKEAFNALLKTLEEPPDHAFFCLATTEMHKIPQTIISRCQIFTFSRFSLPQITDRLRYICDQEGFEASNEALDLIARKAEGGMRDAISILEQVAAETESRLTAENVSKSLGISSSEKLEQLLAYLQQKKTQEALSLLGDLTRQGLDLRSFGHDFLGFLRENMLQSVAQGQSCEFLLPCIEAFEKALARLKSSPIMELPLEIAVIELCQSSTDQRSTINDQRHTPSIADSRSVDQTKSERKHQPLKSTVDSKEKPESGSKNQESESIVDRRSVDESRTDFSVDQVKARMKEIADKAELPAFVKKSFLTTVPSIEEGNLVFGTDSEFHREKLDTPAHRGAIQKAIKELFEGALPIQFLKRNIARSQAPVAQSTGEDKPSAEDFLVF